MTGVFDSSNGAMIDTWISLLISVEEFRKSIYEVGVPFAKNNFVTNWIVDTSSAEGLFRKDVQEFIDQEVAPTFAATGIKYFFIVLPPSAIAKLSAKNVAKINDDQEGMQTVQVASVQEAIGLIKSGR
ncbi:MAG: hypothetical protein HRT61_20560 [Ekhidna sp.]|nr:hypothetical protein [Ekhidna sp.]